MKMKKRSIIIVVILVILALGFVGVRVMLSRFDADLKQLAQTTVSPVDLASARDGDFQGSFGSFPVSAEVKVTIQDHAIKGIELLKHDNGQGKGAEVLPGRVVAAQSVAVDCVSGATYSSKVILKAIEQALLNAGGKAASGQ